MPPTPTFWMRQRQVKVEEGGPDHLKLTAPNLPGFELRLRQEDGQLTALLFPSGQTEPLAALPTGFADPDRAWQVGFELFRQQVIS